MRSLILASLTAVLFFPPMLSAGEKKPPPITIRLHGQGAESDGPSFVKPLDLQNPPEKIFIRIVPVITERDIKAFYPFPGRDGMIGAYFRLDPHGTDKLLQFSVEDRGKLGIFLVNGRAASVAKVDKKIQDGILYLPGGLLPNEVQQLEAKFPVMGNEENFRKKPKKEKPPVS